VSAVGVILFVGLGVGWINIVLVRHVRMDDKGCQPGGRQWNGLISVSWWIEEGVGA